MAPTPRISTCTCRGENTRSLYTVYASTMEKSILITKSVTLLSILSLHSVIRSLLKLDLSRPSISRFFCAFFQELMEMESSQRASLLRNPVIKQRLTQLLASILDSGDHAVSDHIPNPSAHGIANQLRQLLAVESSHATSSSSSSIPSLSLSQSQPLIISGSEESGGRAYLSPPSLTASANGKKWTSFESASGVKYKKLVTYTNPVV